jgi:hypothetical protein
MAHSLLETVRRAYKREDFWAHEAKGLYSAFGLFRRTIKLDRTIAAFVREFADFQEHYGLIPMLERTSESLQDFFSRLASSLTLRGQLSPAERRGIRTFRKGDTSFPVPMDDHAQAVFLKACLELGRFRPATRRGGGIGVGELRTIGELLDYPLDKLLPTSGLPRESPLTLDKAKTIVEYHLAIASDVGDRDYWRAVEEVASRFELLSEAHQSLNTKACLTPSDRVFVSHYERYRGRVVRGVAQSRMAAGAKEASLHDWDKPGEPRTVHDDGYPVTCRQH